MKITSKAIKLNSRNLALVPSEVAVPRYNRDTLEKAIVHVGVGGFHRAHQALYLDRLLANPNNPRLGEAGIGLLKTDERMRDALEEQDCLYTLVERSAGSQTAQIIGSMTEYIHAPTDREAALERMAAVETRIVSLTVTEGGYFIDEGTGKVNLDHAAIRQDLEHPHEPVTSVGCLVEALDRRMLRGLAPFTVMSCDNLQGNGHITKQLLVAYSGLRDTGLQKRIETSVAFPNSMVDRITPMTTAEDITFVQDRFGIDDAWPVVSEPYLQWVIEDEFGCGRPRWEEVGAQIVTDVTPYEMMKIRLLNGSHLAMGYVGALAGYTFVHELMQDETILRFTETFMQQVSPAVPVIAGVSVQDYQQMLIQRFANPAIRDQVTRICSDGSAKLPKWILPTLATLMEHGLPIDLVALVIASWIQYLRVGVDDAGRPLSILDPRAAELIAIARGGEADPMAILSVGSIFAPSLPANAMFVRKVAGALRMLSDQGALATVRHYTARAVSA